MVLQERFIKYLQCDRRRTNQCGGRAIFSEDGNTVEKKIHNHPRDYTLHDISIFREELKRAIKSELNDAGDIYDRLARLHPQAAARVKRNNALQCMRRWSQTNIQIPKGKSFKELRDALYTDRFLTLRKCADGTFIDLIVNNENLPAETIALCHQKVLYGCKNASSLYIVTTGKIKLKNLPTEEILMVVADLENYAVPCMIVIGKQRKEAIYSEALGIIAAAIPSVKMVYTNFEVRLKNQVQVIFPHAEIKGTFYCYLNIIYKLAMKYDLLKDDNDAIIIRKVIALSMILSTATQELYVILWQSLPLTQRPRFEPFFTDYHNIWIQNAVNECCTYENIAIFNDCQRSALRNLINFMNNYEKSTIWHVLKYINKLSMSTVRDLPRLNLKKVYIATPRARSLVDKAQYCDNARVLEKKQITLNTFIKSCSFLVCQTLENTMFEREYEAETDTYCFSDNNSQHSSFESGLDLQSIDFINAADIYEELDYKSKLEKITQLTDDTDNTREAESEGVAVCVQPEEVAGVQPEQAADAQPKEVTVVQDPMSIEKATTLIQLIEENENPASSFLNEDGASILCVACFATETQYMLSPCGHTILCKHCTIKVLYQFIIGATPEFKCRVCGSPFEELQQLFFIE
ncbi:uncharacterized protein LOC123266067 [Cotesia glomerata]|uniref:uncharacterized protein LOC123266067 n=1 Tax=Cotesia glomerata TaxID=32391 RepID=UPI001D0080B4|nr:uncharacterized protein LOC123266067 [Cotesia glomerata]